MQTVKRGGQSPWNNPQVVARHGEDLQVVRTIEHVIWKPSITQLVVVEIHRPVNHVWGTRLNGHNSTRDGFVCIKQACLPQFWFMAKCIWVDPCDLISSKISTNQRGW